MNDQPRLSQQIEFLVEIDKLKGVLRRTWLMDASRRENDAEHSWHLGVLAVLLAEYAPQPDLDLLRVIEMVLLHDVVEIDAGDTYAYDPVGQLDQPQRERKAADRLFHILPADQAQAFRGLWDEFEAGETAEARYAVALDCLQPFLHNYYTQGKAWQEHGITSDQVVARTRRIADGAPVLWKHVDELIRDAVAKGYLAE